MRHLVFVMVLVVAGLLLLVPGHGMLGLAEVNAQATGPPTGSAVVVREDLNLQDSTTRTRSVSLVGETALTEVQGEPCVGRLGTSRGGHSQQGELITVNVVQSQHDGYGGTGAQDLWNDRDLVAVGMRQFETTVGSREHIASMLERDYYWASQTTMEASRRTVLTRDCGHRVTANSSIADYHTTGLVTGLGI